MKSVLQCAIILFVFTAISYNANSQADTLVRVCDQHMKFPYISDGQQYQTILNGDEVAEFRATFYGGSQYRIVGCSGQSDGNLEFILYDREKNALFSNADYENAPYWDFKFSNTMDCIIEAKLDSKNVESGFAIMLIGFKEK